MTTKQIANIASFIVLLGGSMLLGLLGQPAEMGLAIVAGALGLAFLNIEKFESFKGAGFEAKLRDQIQAVIDKETEQESDDITTETYDADEDTKKVVAALKNPKYTWRYMGGLSKESGVAIEKVDESLKWLTDNELAKLSRGKKGRIWSLSAKGREVFAGVG